MTNEIEVHYSGNQDIASAIAEGFAKAGKDIGGITTADLAMVDEFHIRGRKATLELGERMELTAASHVLDIGSGLGGPARTLAETYGCQVTGIDLTEAFCRAAQSLSQWVGLQDRVSFQQGDATALPFADGSFDAAMTIHVAMNIAAKDAVYANAKRVLKPGGIFAIYDILLGETGQPGGFLRTGDDRVPFPAAHFAVEPVPWAREPSISHLATPAEMESLLAAAGFSILEARDSTEESQAWFEKRLASMKTAGPPPLSFSLFLGEDFAAMTRNQVQNLKERRIRTVTYICRA